MEWKTQPEMEIDAKKTYQASIETNKGTMVMDLHAAEAPITVNNFVFFGASRVL